MVTLAILLLVVLVGGAIYLNDRFKKESVIAKAIDKQNLAYHTSISDKCTDIVNAIKSNNFTYDNGRMIMIVENSRIMLYGGISELRGSRSEYDFPITPLESRVIYAALKKYDLLY